MHTTEARIDRGVIKRTANSPHMIECSDGRTYVVKPRSGDRQFANEMVSAALGSALGLPLPRCALVSIDSLFLDAATSAAAKYQVGVHFATEFEKNSWTFDNPAPGIAVKEICNLDSLYGLVMFGV